MSVNKITGSINKIVLSGLILVFSIISAVSVNAGSLTKTKSSANEGIVGIWQLNRNASDKVFKKVSSKTTELPPPVLFAPESLILAADEGINEITINEGFEKVVHTQTLPTDGTIITKKIPSIGQISAKAFWNNKKLVVEITTSKGDRMTETFELSSNQKRLNVTLAINDSNSGKPLTLKRVYNRMPEPAEDKTAAVGITEYPL